MTIVAHMLRDPRLAAEQVNKKDDFPRLKNALLNRGEIIRTWCEEWIIDERAGWTEVVEKCEELFWLATVLASSTSRPGYKGPPRIDFFLMHTLTSAIFLPGMLEILSPSSRIQLLHAHFRVTIGYWISRGRPVPYIQETLMAATDSPQPPTAKDYEESAIRRKIKKGGTEEVKLHEDSMKKAKEEEKENAESSRPASPQEADKDGHVEVSLDDEPTKPEETPQDPSQEAQDQEDPKTPTLNSNRQLEPVVSKPRSSAAVWSSIIASAVDHSDEHATK